MRTSFLTKLLACAICFLALAARAEPPKTTVTIHSEPLNSGTIDPMIFGNFIELLDDVVPGMWAEMLNDRSFEGILPAANWSYYDGSPDICDRPWDTNASWKITTNNPFNGHRCAEITAGDSPGILTQSGLIVRKGMGYLVSGYLRAEGHVQARISLKCLLPTGEWFDLASADLPEPSSSWQKFSVKIPSIGESDRAVFELSVKGSGTLCADKLSLMPADNMNGWRRDVVEAVKAVKPSLIRWGGSSIDPGAYRWKECIGDRDARVPWPNKVWGRLDPNDVGIDEFCQFCELVGAEPLVCVSFSDSPQSAADLVEYCNGSAQSTWGAKRAANGHPESYHVKYWQVGNEISGDNEQYLSALPAFIKQMKATDAGIQIMTSFPSKKLFERVGKEIDFVCPHHYTSDLAWCERDFEQTINWIANTPGCSNVKIGVTEWNTDAGAWGLGRGQFATLKVALANARYLHVMMRHCDKVKIGCRSNLANSYCGAIIETAPGGYGVLKRPSYWVMDLYANHALPIPLRTEQSNNGVDVFACAADDKKSAVVFVVNSKPEPVTLSLSFTGFDGTYGATKAESVCDTLNTGQSDIENHWNSPDRVKIVTLPTTRDGLTLPPLSATAIECQ